MFNRSIALCVALGLSVTTYAAQRPLDIYLNTIRLDAHSPDLSDKDNLQISPDAPVGQTFRTGERAEKIYRIAVFCAFWSESWQPDESIVLTLWDSPAKTTACGQFKVSYFQRMFERSVMYFTIDARVEPNRTYYFELTVERGAPRPSKIPREWLLTDLRPGFGTGDWFLGGIGRAKGDYPDGQAYIAGEPQEFDLWFQVHSRMKIDRDELYASAFERFELSYPPLATFKELVEARRWDDAVTELVRYFESRTDLVKPELRTPEFDPTYDTREADLAAIQQVWVPEDKSTVSLAPFWNYYAWWPQRGGVGLTRGGLRKPLGEAYQKTGNEKYARAFNDMLADFFVGVPSPALAGAFGPDEEIPCALGSAIDGGTMWSALSIGARMLHGFHYYSIFADSPFFTEDVRAKWIVNMGEMAEVLERQKGAGNWETQMADALFQFGVTYPEFKKAAERAQKGLNTLVDNALRTVRSDGVLQEPTVGYHNLVLNRYSKVIQQVRESGLEGLVVPEKMVELTEKMFEYFMYATLPDGSLPIWGDTNHPFVPDLLERGAEMYDRDDFLYVCSRGEKGTPPSQTSYAFPDGGFYYMRNDWSNDSNYMGVHAGPHGSHGHLDALSFTLAAFGRTVLIDPGVHTYGTEEAHELISTRSHNTITVDGHNSRSAIAQAWAAAPGFDFLAGRNNSYDDLKDVYHHRRFWFLKSVQDTPDVWVLFDDIVGKGERTAEMRYRFAPVGVTADAESGCVWTTEDSGNLHIQVRSEPAAKLELGEGIAVWGDLDKRNEKGDLQLGTLQRVPQVTYTLKSALPLSLVSVLTPSPSKDVRTWKQQSLACEPATPDARAVWLERGADALVVACNGLATLSADPTPMVVTLPDGRKLEATAAGAAMRFRKVGDVWQPVTVHGVRSALIRLGERQFQSGDVVNAFDYVLQ